MTIQQKLEALFDKVRALPEPRQLAAVEALAEITQEPYVLSDEERAILDPALAEAKRGENLIDDEDLHHFLDKP
jgi:hypothetical protein